MPEVEHGTTTKEGKTTLPPGHAWLHVHSELYGGTYPVEILGESEERIRVSLPMQNGRVVLLPVGTSVLLEGKGQSSPIAGKIVDRRGGATRALVIARARPDAPLLTAAPSTHPATMVAIASGKGGVGCSVLAANLGAALAEQGKSVCVVDAAAGAGNLHLLLNTDPPYAFGHVLSGERSILEAVAPGPGNVLVLAGGPGVIDVTRLSSRGFARLVRQLEHLAHYVDFVLMDAGTGLGREVIDWLGVADECILVTTTEPPAVTNLYALIREAAARWPGFRARLVINASAGREDEGLGEKVAYAARRLIGADVEYVGSVPRDREVERSVWAQQPVLLRAPRSAAAEAMRALGRALTEQDGHEKTAALHSWADRLRALWNRRSEGLVP